MPDNKTVTFDASQYQLVPKVPTEEMLKAGSNKKNYGITSDVYVAMLAAAPTPAAQSAGQEAVFRLRKHDDDFDVEVQASTFNKMPKGDYFLYAAPVNGGERVTDGLTNRKADDIAARDGYKFTGYVLTNDAGKKCVVNMSAVRWVSQNEFWLLMHGQSALDVQPNPPGTFDGMQPAVRVEHSNGTGERAADAQQVNVQPTHEQAVRFAIDGAIGFGMQGTNQPPDGHWLAEYWEIGRKLAALTSPAKVEVQPAHEQNARFAIDGAISLGMQGIKQPDADHWLAKYWDIGRQLAAKVGGDGLIEQHARDSAELRRLCAARDEARRTAEYWKANHLAGNTEIERLKKLLEAKVGGDEPLELSERHALDSACADIAAVHLALDLPEEDAGGVDAILEAIEELKRRAALSADGGEAANLEGLRDKLFDGRPVTRDAEGWYYHPALPHADEDVDFEKLLTALRIESVFLAMEDDNPEASERYGDAGEADCHYWTPTPPEGDDWCLLAVYDTEDGPYALFGRDAYVAEQKRKQERTRQRAEAIAANQARKGE
ncbi:hypothetical protein [Pandoraea sputorum]|uniref:hypothetical protein n=1 Tax=Pandoraea sputorum TaxID=93222 RepID=UPI0012407D05|nr:hypothetical protein [Pandoraea sputorum]VVE78135.1 hypothetical protein PSP31120_01515 [Pandoraea sputorum]